MLTKKQLDLLEFIHKRVQRDGVPPSFDEMKEALDLRSKSGIHRLITALEERGFIRRLDPRNPQGREWRYRCRLGRRSGSHAQTVPPNRQHDCTGTGECLAVHASLPR